MGGSKTHLWEKAATKTGEQDCFRADMPTSTFLPWMRRTDGLSKIEEKVHLVKLLLCIVGIICRIVHI